MICLDYGFKYLLQLNFLAYKNLVGQYLNAFPRFLLIVRIDSISLWLRVVSWFSLWFFCHIFIGINWTHISIEPWVPVPMVEKEFLPVAKPPDANVPNQMHQSLGLSPRDTHEIYILSCVNVKRLHFLVGWDFVPGFPGRWWMRTSPNDFGTDGSPLTHGWRKPGWPLRKSQKASIHKIII